MLSCAELVPSGVVLPLMKAVSWPGGPCGGRWEKEVRRGEEGGEVASISVCFNTVPKLGGCDRESDKHSVTVS